MADKEFGVIGLGRMGGGLALQAMEDGMRVVGLTQGGASAALLKAGLVEVHDATGFVRQLRGPRIIFLYIPAGPLIDEWLGTLAKTLQPGDIVVDGGNSYWGDSIRRARRLKARDISLIDLGTSGGVTGARHGACFMAGGDREAVQRVEPILLPLAVDGGYVHAGPSGAGHFTKLVHNGIEFGMLQAIGEGMALLENWGGTCWFTNLFAVETSILASRGFWRVDRACPRWGRARSPSRRIRLHDVLVTTGAASRPIRLLPSRS